MGEAPPVPARPAATVLLVRDGAAGLEVFMVVRHRAIEFAGGALVFPGGRVEEADGALAGDDPLGAYRIAGIRETFEECGVLLARPRGEAEMIRADRLLGDGGAGAGEGRRALWWVFKNSSGSTKKGFSTNWPRTK